VKQEFAIDRKITASSQHSGCVDGDIMKEFCGFTTPISKQSVMIAPHSLYSSFVFEMILRKCFLNQKVSRSSKAPKHS